MKSAARNTNRRRWQELEKKVTATMIKSHNCLHAHYLPSTTFLGSSKWAAQLHVDDSNNVAKKANTDLQEKRLVLPLTNSLYHSASGMDLTCRQILLRISSTQIATDAILDKRDATNETVIITQFPTAQDMTNSCRTPYSTCRLF